MTIPHARPWSVSVSLALCVETGMSNPLKPPFPSTPPGNKLAHKFFWHKGLPCCCCCLGRKSVAPVGGAGRRIEMVTWAHVRPSIWTQDSHRGIHAFQMSSLSLFFNPLGSPASFNNYASTYEPSPAIGSFLLSKPSFFFQAPMMTHRHHVLPPWGINGKTETARVNPFTSWFITPLSSQENITKPASWGDLDHDVMRKDSGKKKIGDAR